MADLGLIGALIPEKYGGAGMDFVSQGIICEEMTRADRACGSVVSMSGSLIAQTFLQWGTEEQKLKYLPPMCRGEKLGAAALTEPSGGSDLAALETTATRQGNYYLLTGQKCFISHGNEAVTFVVLASIDLSLRHKGITCFVVERSFPGFTTRAMPLRVFMRGGVAELTFDNCLVPMENRIGEEGRGFRIIASSLDIGRFSIAARAVGSAQACVDEGLKYARERVQFGQEIGRFQLIQEMIADMVTSVEAARLLTYRVGQLKDAGFPRVSKEASIAKLFATETNTRCAAHAMQIHGAYGFSADFPIGRHFAESRISLVGEGTSELQKMLVAEYALEYRKY
jgi:glutaryl-CoA dehydrogenase (non-decarboxylating)